MMIVILHRLDKNDLLKKKQACSNANSDVFIADNYCDQNRILISKNQSLKENPHLREDNDRVSLYYLFNLKNKKYIVLHKIRYAPARVTVAHLLKGYTILYFMKTRYRFLIPWSTLCVSILGTKYVTVHFLKCSNSTSIEHLELYNKVYFNFFKN